MWVYWDPKFRTSQQVLLDILLDLKNWLRANGEPDEVVLGLDNLREQCSLPFQEVAANVAPRMQLAYTPENTTDLCSVTDYDLGRLDKKRIRDQFFDDFNERPDDWCVPGDKGGVSEREFRILITKWTAKAWEQRDTKLICSRFKKCGMFNSLDGSENKLIEIRGLPNYSIDREVPHEKKALDHYEDEEEEGDRTPTEGESEDLSLSENCYTDRTDGAENSESDDER